MVIRRRIGGNTTSGTQYKEMENIASPGSVVTEHSLLTFTNSSTLDEALEILIETSKDEHGRLHLASEKILSVVLVLTKSLIEPPHRHHLFSCLKLLRNLCAGEILNQNSFIKEKGVDIISSVFSSVNIYSNSESDYEIIRIGLQLLGNVSVAGKEHQTAVWDRFFPTGFADIARVRRLEICDPLCMILYTCCNGNHERVVEICGVPGLQIITKIISTASTVGFREDWLQWLLVKICFDESHFSPLFSELSSTGAPGCSDDRKSTDNHFTKENAFLLSVLSESLNQQLNEITVHREFPLCILGILRKVVGVVDFFSRGTSGLPTDSAAVDVLGYSITILRDICAQDKRNLKTKGMGNDVTDSLISAGLVDLVLDLLRDLEPPAIIKKSISNSEDQVGKAASASLKVCPYKGFRRDIVAVIGNCLYRSKHLQDEIRKKGDILLLLQQCVTDDDNQFLREWGIWTVRNLLEGNEENQRQVEELELQGSADVPILAGLGLRVEVDKLTRRAKLVNAQ